MATPKNIRNRAFILGYGGSVHTYTNDELIILQIRKTVPTETDILQPSFKIAVRLSPQEALAIASELILAVSQHFKDSSLEKNDDSDSL